LLASCFVFRRGIFFLFFSFFFINIVCHFIP
jgi:hypothetical protein